MRKRNRFALLCAGLAAALLVGCASADDPMFIITIPSSSCTSTDETSSMFRRPGTGSFFEPQGPLSLEQHPEYADCTLSEAGYIDRDGVFHFCPVFNSGRLPENGDTAFPLLRDGAENVRSHWVTRDFVAAQLTDGTFCGISRMKSATKFLDGLFTYGDLGKDILSRLAEWPSVVQVFPLTNDLSGGLYFAAQSSDGTLRTLSLNTLYLPKKAQWVERLEEVIGDRYISAILPYQTDAPLVMFTDGTVWCADGRMRDQIQFWEDLVQIAPLRGYDQRDGAVGLRADGTLYNCTSFPVSVSYSSDIVRIFTGTGSGSGAANMLLIQRTDGAILDVYGGRPLGLFPMLDQAISVGGLFYGVTEDGAVILLSDEQPKLGSYAEAWSKWALTLRDVRTVTNRPAVEPDASSDTASIAPSTSSGTSAR